MSPSRLPLHRWLPPLVVLGALALLLWSTLATGGRSRAREEALLRARVAEPSSRASVGRDVDAYLARHATDPQARWLAVELHARRLDLRSALAAFEGDPAVRDAPGAARRFATTILRWLGDKPADGPPGSWLFSHALLARLDGGDPDASKVLDDLVSAVTPQELANTYLPAHRAATRGALRMAEAWARRASEREFLVTSSAIRARPGDTAVAEALRPVLESSWRTERPVLWTHVARALGTVGDPLSVAALRRERDLASGDGLDDLRRRLACEVGLALAGDADALASLLRGVDDPARDWTGVQLAIGLDARRRAGDAKAARTLVELWGHEKARTTRLQIGMCTFVDDAEPEGLPADEWAAVLAAGDVRTGRVIAHAWSLRRGRPGAAATLLADLRETLSARDVVREAQSVDDDDGAAVVEALRAFVRWG